MTEHTGKSNPFVVEADITPPDPRVVETLRSVVGEPPYDAVDWNVLRASIVGDAAAFFHERIARRVRRSWTTYVASWAAATIPVGIAASIVAALVMSYTPATITQSNATETVALTPAGLLSTVTGFSSRGALTASVTASLGDLTDRENALLGEETQ